MTTDKTGVDADKGDGEFTDSGKSDKPNTAVGMF